MDEGSLPYRSVGFQLPPNNALPTIKGVGLHYVTSPSYSWDNRKREDRHCLLQYTVSGSGMLESERREHKQEPGDAFFIDIPSETRYYLPHSSDHWEVLFIELSKECLPLLYRIVDTCRGATAHLQGSPGLGESLCGIYRLALNHGLDTLFDNTRIAYHLLIDVLQYVSTLQIVEQGVASEAKRYIDDHYASPTICLNEIASKIGISKYHISREFSRRFGITPNHYLTQVRIDHACSLLQQKQAYSLEEIAQMTGFSNGSYFGKVFRRVRGITPSEFRRENASYDIVRVVHQGI